MSDWADICEMFGHSLAADSDDVLESMGIFSKEESDDYLQYEEEIEVVVAGYRMVEVKTFSVKTFSVMEVYDDGTEELFDYFDSEDKALECVRSWNENNKEK